MPFKFKTPCLFVIAFLTVNVAFAQVDSLSRPFKISDLQKNQLFVGYLKKFKLLVKNNDKQGLASFLESSYFRLWITIDKPGNKPYNTIGIKVKNKADFFKYYTKVFDQRMRSTIVGKQLNTTDFHYDYNGICLHRGQVWFQYDKWKKKVWVSSINNVNYAFP